MEIRVYGYRGCSTCRRAYAFLKERGVAFTEVDVTEHPPTLPELRGMLAALGGNVRKLFNTSGQVYRELRLGDQLADMPEKDALALLAGNGRLVKRPFLIVGGAPRTVGFTEEAWNQALDQ